MNTVKEIEEAVQHLPPNDLDRFRAWFETFEAAKWERKMEGDVAAGRLDHLIKEAETEYKSGNTTEL